MLPPFPKGERGIYMEKELRVQELSRKLFSNPRLKPRDCVESTA